MKRNLALSILFLSLAAAMSMSQTPPAASAKQIASTPQSAPPEKIASARPDQATESSGDLNAVLAKMNQSSKSFQSAQGDFEFQSYQQLVNETDTQRGRIYFRKKRGGVDAAFKIEGPAPKQVVYKDGQLLVYEEKIKQITERNVSNNKTDVEAFLSLGFGASGDDLLRAYDVKMDGWETVDGVKTAKLDLVPKNDKMRQTYSKIVLWIDPERDVLLQQKFFEPSGDYRLAHYTNVKRNADLPDNAFNLKTSGKVTTIHPQ